MADCDHVFESVSLRLSRYIRGIIIAEITQNVKDSRPRHDMHPIISTIDSVL